MKQKEKRGRSLPVLILSILMITVLCSGASLSFAGDSAQVYVLGDGVQGSIREDGVLVIEGTGPLYDYSPENPAPFYDRRAEITGVEMTEGISSIGEYLFYNCYRMGGTLTIPSTVVRIGDQAFSGIGKAEAPRFERLTNLFVPESIPADTGTEPVPDASAGTEPAPDAGTNDGTEPAPDTGTNGGTEPTPDAGTNDGTEPAPDTGTNDGTEPTPDTGTNGGTEPMPDAGTNDGTEPAPDAGTNGGTEPTPDTGTNDGTEPAPDAGTNGGTEPTPDTGAEMEPGTDAGTQTPADQGTDTTASDGTADTTDSSNETGETAAATDTIPAVGTSISEPVYRAAADTFVSVLAAETEQTVGTDIFYPGQTGIYQCDKSNLAFQLAAEAAGYQPYDVFSIVREPENLYLYDTEWTASVWATAEDESGITYQWEKGIPMDNTIQWGPLEGEVLNTLSLAETDVQTAYTEGIKYRCVVSYGQTRLTSAEVYVSDQPAADELLSLAADGVPNLVGAGCYSGKHYVKQEQAGGTELTVTSQSSFTMQFESIYTAAPELVHTLSFAAPLPVGTALVLTDLTGGTPGYFYYNVETEGTSSILFSQFCRMGTKTEQYQEAIEGERAETLLISVDMTDAASAAGSILPTLTLGETMLGTFQITLTDPVYADLSTFNVEGQTDPLAEVMRYPGDPLPFIAAVQSGAYTGDTYLEGRQTVLAIWLEKTGMTEKQDFTVLSGGTAHSSVGGVVSLAPDENGRVSFTVNTPSGQLDAGEYTIYAQVCQSPSAAYPLADARGNAQSIRFQIQEEPEYLLDIMMADAGGKVVEFTDETAQQRHLTVTMQALYTDGINIKTGVEVQKKTASGYETVTNSGWSIEGLPNTAGSSIIGSPVSVVIPASAAESNPVTYRLLFYVEADGVRVAEKPCNFIIK
ncbi:hypothetical protein [Anaerolentibacter hominis]|uniref:hypothetical protein n=1 Tax=Anaerolentibacter hominis TaxID=3079009 RepID=UPI0031B8304F